MCKTPFSEHLWKLRCWKSARRRGGSTCRSQNGKSTHHVRSTFGRSNVIFRDYNCSCDYNYTSLQLHYTTPHLQLHNTTPHHILPTATATTATATTATTTTTPHNYNHNCNHNYNYYNYNDNYIYTRDRQIDRQIDRGRVREGDSETQRLRDPTTFRSISGFALPPIHHSNSLLLWFRQLRVFQISAITLCGTTDTSG